VENREILLEEIKKLDRNSYNEYLLACLLENSSEAVEKAYFIFSRFLFLKLYEKKKMIKPLLFYRKLVQLYKELTTKILNSQYNAFDKKNPEGVIKKFNLDKMVSQAYRVLNRGDYLEMLTREGEYFYAVEYYYYRCAEKTSVSQHFKKEIKILFNLNDDEANKIQIQGLAKLRNNHFEGITAQFGLMGKFAQEFINHLYSEDIILARILEDWLIQIGHDGLGRFLIMYSGMEVKIPNVWDVLKKKEIV
jgi:hypothetical protein